MRPFSPRALAVPALLGALALGACRSGEDAPSEPAEEVATATEKIPFRQDGTLRITRDGQPVGQFAVEIAETDSSRERGLMERGPLPLDRGMLFLFPAAGPQSFWMANTPSPLDIVFIGADSTVVNVAKYTTPYSTAPVSSTGPAQFVLEVRASVADRLGLSPGDRVTWTRG